MYRKTIIFFFALQTLPAMGQELATDRPDQTETPFVVPFRSLQAECGFLRQFNSDEKRYEQPSILWRAGIASNMEMRLITTYSAIHSNGKKNTGVEPLQVGFKLKVRDESGLHPAMGFIMHVVIPRAASLQFRNANYACNFRFTAQHTISQRVNISYNAGMEWDGNHPAATFIYTFTSGLRLTDKLGMFIEIFGDITESSNAIHSLDGGLTYLLRPHLQADLSAGAHFKEPGKNYFLSAGISFLVGW
jgi:hypothetical protein